MSTMEEDTSATGSMGSADPGGVAVGSEPSAEPSLAAADADIQSVVAPSRVQRAPALEKMGNSVVEIETRFLAAHRFDRTYGAQARVLY